MRDPNRIPEMLSELERIWKANPDFRLGQLLVVAARPKTPCPEVFYIEDDKLLAGLLSYENRKNEDPAPLEPLPAYKERPNIASIKVEYIRIDDVKKLIDIIKTEDQQMVISPISLLSFLGAPATDDSWISTQKPRVNKLKALLEQLKDEGFLEGFGYKIKQA